MPTEDQHDPHLRERRVGSTLLHRGFLELRRDQRVRRRAARRAIRSPRGAVAVLALLGRHPQGATDRAWCVRHYANRGQGLLELPAASLTGEFTRLRRPNFRRDATRGEWAYGGEIHNAAAYSTESIWLWFARGLHSGPTRLDDGEFVETAVLKLTELQALSCGDGLPDVKTQIGISWLGQWRSGRRSLSWHGVPGHPDL